MSLVQDEYGNHFLIVKEQDRKRRESGLETIMSNIAASKAICNLMKSSLGPKGMDKILVSQDGDITITNDGATILKEMSVESQIARLLVDLSQSQDKEIGDGTTGVVVLAGALLEQSEVLLEKGIHPTRIAEGFERACNYAVKTLEQISDSIDISPNSTESLQKIAKASLGSKIVSKCHSKFASIAVDAVTAVADFERKDINFDLIKIVGKTGGELEDTEFYKGILIEKEFSHVQMPKVIKGARIAILTCPFEPPRPKTKHKLDISCLAEFRELQKYEKETFEGMIKTLKDASVNLVICQWGFDDEANHLLLQNNINAVRWVGGSEIEMIALCTQGRIIPRFIEITHDKLGEAECVSELSYGTMKENLIFVEGCSNSRACTVLVRGGNKMIIEEAKRSLHDAICAVRNLILDNRIVYGGGSSEMACANTLFITAESILNMDQHCFRSFAVALESIPAALAYNSGLNSIDVVSNLRSLHAQGLKYSGVDCNSLGTYDMRAQNIFETFAAKKQQYLLATQVVRMILKIDDQIIQGI